MPSLPPKGHISFIQPGEEGRGKTKTLSAWLIRIWAPKKRKKARAYRHLSAAQHKRRRTILNRLIKGKGKEGVLRSEKLSSIQARKGRKNTYLNHNQLIIRKERRRKGKKRGGFLWPISALKKKERKGLFLSSRKRRISRGWRRPDCRRPMDPGREEKRKKNRDRTMPDSLGIFSEKKKKKEIQFLICLFFGKRARRSLLEGRCVGLREKRKKRERVFASLAFLAWTREKKKGDYGHMAGVRPFKTAHGLEKKKKSNRFRCCPTSRRRGKKKIDHQSAGVLLQIVREKGKRRGNGGTKFFFRQRGRGRKEKLLSRWGKKGGGETGLALASLPGMEWRKRGMRPSRERCVA